MFQAGRTSCAFLNANISGGALYFGVHDSGVVQGIGLSQDERDQLGYLLTACGTETEL
jgi:predicted HTH transcriptional regulator